MRANAGSGGANSRGGNGSKPRPKPHPFLGRVVQDVARTAQSAHGPAKAPTRPAQTIRPAGQGARPASDIGRGRGSRIAAAQNRVVAHDVKDTKGAADRGRAPAYIRKHAADLFNADLKDVGLTSDGGVTIHKRRRFLPDTDLTVSQAGVLGATNRLQAAKTFRAPKGLHTSSIQAPVLQVLNQTTRLTHAQAGAVDAYVHGGGPLAVGKAALRGVENKDRHTFSDVYKSAGLPKPAAAALGLATDIGADPTTYLTGGESAVGRVAAEKGLARVARKADAKGLSESGKATVLRAAAKRQAPGAKGVSLRFAGPTGKHGFEVPGVTRATAAVGKGAKAVARRAPQGARDAGATLRGAAREVHPTLRPAGADPAEFSAVRGAARQARSSDNQMVGAAQRQALALRKQIGEENYGTVIDHIEQGKIGALPEGLRSPAKFLQDNLRHQHRLRRQAGLPVGTIKNYFPHADVTDLGKGEDIVDARPLRTGRGQTVKDVGSNKKRTDLRTVAAINADGARELSTNVPQVFDRYSGETSHVVNQSRFLRQLADAGRPLREAPKADDAVFHFAVRDGRYAAREVPKAEVETALSGGAKKSGRYVVFHKQVAKEVMQGMAKRERSNFGRVIDKRTGTFKRVATGTPGFHIRNAIGDTQMGYLSQPAITMPGHALAAGKGLKALSKAEHKPLDQVKLPGWVQEAVDHGVVRSGYVGRELEDLTRGTGKYKRAEDRKIPIARKFRARTKAASTTAGVHVKRAMANREDLQRLATYRQARREGKSASEAADVSLNTHIDYADTSEVEKKYLRRVFPFYTFSSRSVPLHASKLLTKPGKFANYEKIREEAAKAAGFNDTREQERDTPDYQNRQAPIALRIGGKKIGLSAGLPLTSLNEVPTGLNPAKYGAELTNFGLASANPVLKDPIELTQNHSFFTGREVEPATGPLVAAPAWVAKLPAALQKKAGVTHDYVDKRTGKRELGWRGNADYVAKAIPGAPYLLNQLATEGANRRGQGTVSKVVSGLGVKPDPVDARDTQIGNLKQHLADLSKKQAAFSQQGIGASNPTKAYMKVAADIKRTKQHVAVLTRRRGDAVPYGASRQTVAGGGRTVHPAGSDPLSIARANLAHARAASPGADEALKIARANIAAARGGR